MPVARRPYVAGITPPCGCVTIISAHQLCLRCSNPVDGLAMAPCTRDRSDSKVKLL